MRRLGSLIIAAADRTRVPAGSALAVDRDEFARSLTTRSSGHPLVEVVREEVTRDSRRSVHSRQRPAHQPRAAKPISNRLIGARHLYFYDAIAPIVSAESIDMEVAFRASRWGRAATTTSTVR